MATQSVSERMRERSDDELASIQATEIGRPNAVLARLEFERRAQLAQHKLALDTLIEQHNLAQKLLAEQHQLDLKLVAKQVRWTQFSILASIASALAGVILGWLLQRNWPAAQPQNTAPTVRSQTSPSKTVDSKENAESVPSKPPESKK